MRGFSFFILSALLWAALSVPAGGQEIGARRDTLGLPPGTLVRTETVGRFSVPFFLSEATLYADARVVTDLSAGSETRRYVLVRAGKHSGEILTGEAAALSAALRAMEEETRSKPRTPMVRAEFSTACGLVFGVRWSPDPTFSKTGGWNLYLYDRWSVLPAEFYGSGRIGKLREAVEAAFAALER